MTFRPFLRAAGALALALSLYAEVRLPAILSDHMVVQGGVAVRLWGWADAGESVTASFRGHNATARANAAGRWELYLPASEAGGPFVLTVNGKQIRDVLVGDVWLASGQSNMAFKLERVDDAKPELALARTPRIRFFQTPRRVAADPVEEAAGEWKVASPETAGAFSAVAYLFARGMQEARKIPVGVIEAAYGGTPAQAWTPIGKLTADPLLGELIAVWDKLSLENPRTPKHWLPAGCFNGMIWPIHRYTIRGAIWYQGENNATPGQADHYNRLFETMIRSWRELWGQGDFPFLYVQLPNFAKTIQPSRWAELREAQLQALALANTAMAVAIDVGNPNDVHPTNKRPVAERLVLAARALVYGEKVESSGPLPRRVTSEPGALRLWFDHAAGLTARGGVLQGFEVAGPGADFVPAKTLIEGATIVVSAEGVAAPMRVRYAWGDNPAGNLYNAAGLPASPFRLHLE